MECSSSALSGVTEAIVVHTVLHNEVAAGEFYST